MVERHREAVVVDVCGSCKAVFFDRGELDEVAFLEDGTERRISAFGRPRDECRVCGMNVGGEMHCDVPLDVYCGRCNGLLVTLRTRSVRAEYCPGCGGVTIEAESVKLLAGSMDPPPAPPPPEPEEPEADSPLDWIQGAFRSLFGG